jgi:hypothetical protein
MPLPLSHLVMEVIAKKVDEWRNGSLQSEAAIQYIGRAIAAWIELPKE